MSIQRATKLAEQLAEYAVRLKEQTHSGAPDPREQESSPQPHGDTTGKVAAPPQVQFLQGQTIRFVNIGGTVNCKNN